MMDYGWGFGWMFLGGLLMIAFWAAVIGLAVWLVVKLVQRGLGGGSGGGGSESGLSPLEIAKRRYARGEITKDQYEQLKKDLS